MNRTQIHGKDECCVSGMNGKTVDPNLFHLPFYIWYTYPIVLPEKDNFFWFQMASYFDSILDSSRVSRMASNIVTTPMNTTQKYAYKWTLCYFDFELGKRSSRNVIVWSAHLKCCCHVSWPVLFVAFRQTFVTNRRKSIDEIKTKR